MNTPDLDRILSYDEVAILGADRLIEIAGKPSSLLRNERRNRVMVGLLSTIGNPKDIICILQATAEMAIRLAEAQADKPEDAS